MMSLILKHIVVFIAIYGKCRKVGYTIRFAMSKYLIHAEINNLETWDVIIENNVS